MATLAPHGGAANANPQDAHLHSPEPAADILQLVEEGASHGGRLRDVPLPVFNDPSPPPRRIETDKRTLAGFRRRHLVTIGIGGLLIGLFLGLLEWIHPPATIHSPIVHDLSSLIQATQVAAHQLYMTAPDLLGMNELDNAIGREAQIQTAIYNAGNEFNDVVFPRLVAAFPARHASHLPLREAARSLSLAMTNIGPIRCRYDDLSNDTSHFLHSYLYPRYGELVNKFQAAFKVVLHDQPIWLRPLLDRIFLGCAAREVRKRVAEENETALKDINWKLALLKVMRDRVEGLQHHADQTRDELRYMELELTDLVNHLTDSPIRHALTRTWL